MNGEDIHPSVYVGQLAASVIGVVLLWAINVTVGFEMAVIVALAWLWGCHVGTGVHLFS